VKVEQSAAGQGGRPRRVGVWLHPARAEAVEAAVAFSTAIHRYGIVCAFQAGRVVQMRALLGEGTPIETFAGPDDEDVELLVVLGGDGTILSAAEWALPRRIPLLGVNLGHVGFLAEMESSEMGELVRQVAAGDYGVERRLTLQIELADAEGQRVWNSYAINELSIEKEQRQMMIDVLVRIDGRPLSQWGCDGVLVSTPTGSTAYAFSAGGPVVWPDVEAIELVPLLAHALFARPLVLSPSSVIEVQMTPRSTAAAAIWCDGRRSVPMTAGCTVTVTRDPVDLLLARLKEQPFTTRLVKKFELPINGWRQR